MSKTYAIGIDLGGTSVKYALIDNEGVFHFQGKLPSKADVSAEAVIGQLVAASKETMASAQQLGVAVEGIGIGTPGIVDETNRIVLGGAENIKGWENLNLADRIEAETGLPVQMGNDANLMGLGETMYGAGQGARNVVFLTIGTGIGGAVVIDGKLFNGFANRGTELGHVPLIANGEPCACGSVGCLEHYASTSALVRRFSKRASESGISFPNEEINGELIVRLYKEGDKLATESLEEHCDFLGHGIAGFINIFSPQRIVIGGGLSEAGDFYIQKVSEKAHRYAMADCAVNTRIMAASLGNKAGSIGAASLVFSH
ncbi:MULTISPECIES: ROK family protein [Bacteroides]|uniref:ROK family protein n=1 Tax=Bacteroides TaxID=816 RepID=UPI000E44A099|nr:MULTISPECIES: ROK family protein [Bacteroides]MBS7575536.1 ROK family protein [Bacteroides propionicigenes]RGM27460.1 ROK family protein [Bacteroides sp. OM08-17BH]RHJ52335.1 ROK family protein [Bacteroides sp. AM10-21B]HBO07559.1 sugar kinase [Bacteroides sp.]